MNDAAALCDRVAFIVDGRIKLIDTPRNLKLLYGKKVARVEYWEGGAVQSAEFPLEALADNAEFAAIIRAKRVETIHTLEATLEDVFIACTGRTLS